MAMAPSDSCHFLIVLDAGLSPKVVEILPAQPQDASLDVIGPRFLGPQYPCLVDVTSYSCRKNFCGCYIIKFKYYLGYSYVFIWELVLISPSVILSVLNFY